MVIVESDDMMEIHPFADGIVVASEGAEESDHLEYVSLELSDDELDVDPNANK